MSNKETAFEFFKSGQLDLALKEFLIALESNQRDAECHHYLGALYHVLGQNETARHHLLAATELKPDYATALFDLALVHLAEGDLQDCYDCKIRLDELDGELSMDLIERLKTIHPDFEIPKSKVSSQNIESDAVVSHAKTISQETNHKASEITEETNHTEQYRPF